MKIGVLADSFRLDFKGNIAKAASVGADGVQLYATSGELAPENLCAAKRKEYLQIIKDAGLEISAIEITDLTSLADYFVFATGNSNTQINALCGAVEKALDEQGVPVLRREGYRDGTWVLLDYGDIVVHVFSAEAREFYSLERLWKDGTPIDLSGVLTAN